jgi:hypothetical protein
VLLAAVRQTREGVLEVGGGVYSTSALHTELASVSRTLVTVEPNQAWRSKLVAFECSWHRIVSRAEIGWIDLLPWGVIFLDQEPQTDRPKLLNQLRRVQVDLIVVHDTEDLNARAYGWGESLTGWEHAWHSPERPRAPRTTVLSNRRAFEWSGE